MWLRNRRVLFVAATAALIGVGPFFGSAELPVAGAAPSVPENSPPNRGVTLQASSNEAPAGRKVALTAKVEQRPAGEFVVAIRREGEHLGSGIEKTCRSETICTAELHGDRATSRTYAATLYRCNERGICVADDDDDEFSKQRITWR